ncbi:MAG: glycosyltransferase family 4 protein [Armatimonadota bacterium]|nr:MAG: glycosyltransferase family 4 protein [Armatimonadota bacterium]
MIHVILPSLRISGGVKEALRLGEELAACGHEVDVWTLWRGSHAVAANGLRVVELSQWVTRVRWAALQLPALMLAFARRAARGRGSGWQIFIFTHYATSPLAVLIRPSRRWFFVQDLEWRFVRHAGLRALLKAVVLGLYRRGRLIAANDYLASELRALGLEVAVQAPIWADAAFRDEGNRERDIDVVMMLRKGDHKRLDLYRQALEQLACGPQHRTTAVITPDDDIAAQVAAHASHLDVRPDAAAMRALYARTRLFLMLSEHEGFGLPPLEAMGSGCVPLCRDSGGVRAYMTGELRELLLPLDWPVERIAQRIDDLLTSPEALQRYSTAARAVFDAGLRRSQSRAVSVAAAMWSATQSEVRS